MKWAKVVIISPNLASILETIVVFLFWQENFKNLLFLLYFLLFSIVFVNPFNPLARQYQSKIDIVFIECFEVIIGSGIFLGWLNQTNSEKNFFVPPSSYRPKTLKLALNGQNFAISWPKIRHIRIFPAYTL